MRSRARRGRTLGGAVAVGARDLADGAAVRLDAVHHREEARGVGVEVLRRQSEDSAGLAGTSRDPIRDERGEDKKSFQTYSISFELLLTRRLRLGTCHCRRLCGLNFATLLNAALFTCTQLSYALPRHSAPPCWHSNTTPGTFLAPSSP